MSGLRNLLTFCIVLFKPLPLPDITVADSVHSLAMACIWVHLAKKVNLTYKFKLITIIFMCFIFCLKYLQTLYCSQFPCTLGICSAAFQRIQFQCTLSERTKHMNDIILCRKKFSNKFVFYSNRKCLENNCCFNIKQLVKP